MNPYNCSLPGNLFTGYKEVRGRIIEGLVEGRRSFSIQGGRRCGKTSLLRKLGEDLDAAGVPGLRWCLVDMQAVVPRSPGDFFRALYREIADGIPGAPSVPERVRHYQDFLKLLDEARPALEASSGARWTFVMMVDEIDAAASKLPDEEAFQNLRSLLTASHYANSLRLVATGSSRMINLIKAGSPLSNLERIFLGILPESEAHQLLAIGFPTSRFKKQILNETGCHPYILQGVLGYLWSDHEEFDLAVATRRFTRDWMHIFKQWTTDIGEAGVKVYSKLAKANGRVPAKSLRIEGAILDEVLQRLIYHGLIDDAEPDAPQVSSQIFRRWFLENIDCGTETCAQTVTSDDPIKRVFLVHGRNKKIHASVCHFLRALGLQPLEWGDLVEATGNPAPTIIEILRAGFEKAQAAVVLFTPEDEARLLEEFRIDSDQLHERELTPQPRPNVIFEAGMVMAYFPKRTVIVQLGHIREFSDLAGIHFVRLNNSIQAREEFVRRLRIAQCAIVDTRTTTGWHTAGDFDV